MRIFSSTPTDNQAASAGASPETAASTSTPASTRQLPPDHPPVPEGVDKCPVDDSARSVWMQAGAVSHPFEATSTSSSSSTSSPSSGPDAGKLSQDRVISTIPRGSGAQSTHNTETPSAPADAYSGIGADGKPTENWVYPSEQQFFNAMLRKNNNPRVADMRTVVPIHNAVNEKAWEDILAWEAGNGAEKCGGPRLSSFVGRPKDLTPKAWVKTLFGYQAPFDRHDWYVDRCGKQVRYVIDFYTGRTDPARPQAMSFYLDVRPALDDWEGVRTRLSRWWGA